MLNYAVRWIVIYPMDSVIEQPGPEELQETVARDLKMFYDLAHILTLVILFDHVEFCNKLANVFRSLYNFKKV